MTDFIISAVEYAVNLFISCCGAYLMCACLDKKPKFRTKILPFCTIALVLFAAMVIKDRITIYEGAAIFVYGLIPFVFSMIFLVGPVLKKLFLSIAYVNAIAVSSFFATNFISFICGKPVFEFMATPSFLRYTTVVLANALIFIIVYIVRRIDMKSPEITEKREWAFLILDYTLSVISFMFFYDAIFTDIKANFYLALSAASIITINFTLFFLIAKLNQRHIINTENALLRQQSKNSEFITVQTQQQYEEIRKQRHDFNNTLGIILSLNKEHEEAKISEYIEDYLKSHKRHVHFITTDNPLIDAIINSKIPEAEEHGISFELLVPDSIPDENSLEICTVIGNLLDNAITACSESRAKIMKLMISIDSDRRLTLTVKNTVDSPVLKTNPDLVSKDGDGYGVKIVRDTAAKLGGIADFWDEEGYFCCNVIVFC